MTTPPNLLDAAEREMQEYQLSADLRLQPKWDIPETVAIHTAVSGRVGAGQGDQFPTSIEGFLAAAGDMIEAGAPAVHLDYNWIEDETGRRLDKDMVPAEAYRAVIEPLRARYGTSFITDCNILHGTTFDECVGPVREGLAEIAPCAPGHPDEFMVPAIKFVQESGAKPMLSVHSSGELELAKRKLIDTGILQPPYYWGILYGLPFNTGRSLVSGTWVPNTRDMALHMFLMIDQIKSIDPDSVIMVCAAGRATLYMATLAMMLGVHVRVGTEDTIWKYPNRDDLLSGNREMFEMAKQIAELHGRRVATADEYREMLGMRQPALA